MHYALCYLAENPLKCHKRTMYFFLEHAVGNYVYVTVTSQEPYSQHFRLYINKRVTGT